MEQRHLRYFVAVAEELHFGRAAKRLHLSQPPLSQQIRGLEREIGVELFRRTQRRVELTPAGAAFLPHARRVLAGAEEAAMAARRAARGESGCLTVGFIHAASYELLPGILRRFTRRAPGIEVRLQEMTGTEQIPALLDGRIDIAFLRPPVANAAIRTRVIVREPLVAALPRRHRLAGRLAIGLRELSGERFVMYAPGRSPLHGQVLSACLTAGFTPDVVQQAMHIMTLIGLVRSGVGVALLPRSASAVRMEGIVYRPLRYRGPRAETALGWRQGDVTPVTQAFLAAVGEAVSGRGRSTPT